MFVREDTFCNTKVGVKFNINGKDFGKSFEFEEDPFELCNKITGWIAKNIVYQNLPEIIARYRQRCPNKTYLPVNFDYNL